MRSRHCKGDERAARRAFSQNWMDATMTDDQTVRCLDAIFQHVHGNWQIEQIRPHTWAISWDPLALELVAVSDGAKVAVAMQYPQRYGRPTVAEDWKDVHRGEAPKVVRMSLETDPRRSARRLISDLIGPGTLIASSIQAALQFDRERQELARQVNEDLVRGGLRPLGRASEASDAPIRYRSHGAWSGEIEVMVDGRVSARFQDVPCEDFRALVPEIIAGQDKAPPAPPVTPEPPNAPATRQPMPTTEGDQELLNLLDEPRSQADLARAMGVSRQAISQRVKRLLGAGAVELEDGKVMRAEGRSPSPSLR